MKSLAFVNVRPSGRRSAVTSWPVLVLVCAAAVALGPRPAAGAIPGDVTPPLSPLALAFAYTSGGLCITSDNTTQVHDLYLQQLTTAPVACTTTSAVVSSLRGHVSYNYTTTCNQPAPASDVAELRRFQVPDDVFLSFVTDPLSAASRNAGCAAVCQGAAGMRSVVIALWNSSCLCFNSTLSQAPPHSAPVACCGFTGNGGVSELEAAAGSGRQTTGANLFLVAIGNGCVDVASASCRSNAECATFRAPNGTVGGGTVAVVELGAVCCARSRPAEAETDSSALIYSGVAGCFLLGASMIGCTRIQLRRGVVRREAEERESFELGTIVGGDDAGPQAALRSADEASSLSAAFMFGMRRTTIRGPDATAAISTQGGLPVVGADRDDCTVCLSTFTVGASVSVLPCGHMLHSQCLMDFVTFHLRRYSDLLCPMCRSPLLGSPGGAEAGGKQARRSDAAAAQLRAASNDDGAAVANPAAVAFGAVGGPARGSGGASPLSDDDDDDDVSPGRPTRPMPTNPIAAAAAAAASPGATPASRRPPAATGTDDGTRPLLVLPRYEGSPPR